MSDITAARAMVKQIHVAAEDGQNGSAMYALDRLRVIQQLAEMTLHKLDDEPTDLRRAGAGGLR